MNSHRIEVTTLGDLLLKAADRFPDHDAIIFPDVRLTYAELRDRSYARARSLLGLGLDRGDHIGILMPNCLDYVECLFAAQLIGAMAVPMNARYKAQELAYVVENADLSAILTTDLVSEYTDFVELLCEAFPELGSAPNADALSLPGAPKLRTVAMLGGSEPPGVLPRARLDTLANAPDKATDDDVDQRRVCVQLSDPAIMMYTSGTTSNPKGCPLGHGLLVRTGINMNRERYFLSDADRFWVPLPIFHMSFILPLMCCLDAGAALQSTTHFEAGEALEMMEQDVTTVAFPAFPTITNELINHPDFATRDISQIRRINNVAPPDVLRKFQEAFPHAVQTGAYGLTEVGGVIAFNHPDETLEQRLVGCGKVFPGVEVKVVDPETDEELPPGERGEILVRGYAVFDGYYNAPEKNAEAFTDGWFRTGDLCALDAEGHIEFHGRIKDMLKVGGENVAAIEIESYLANHPAVKLAQVIGVADDRLLEVPAAFIELNPNTWATEDELIDFCKGKIASFKVPRYVRFVEEWPMSSTKVQKFKLRDQFDPNAA